MIGILNQRASLRAQTLTPDGGGGFVESWDEFGQAWVALRILGGSDTLGPDRLESRVRHRLILRRRSDVLAGQRVFVAGRIFRIHNVLDEGSHAATMNLLCEELS